MSVPTYVDYDILMSGVQLPRGVAVKKFIPPRSRLPTQVWESRQVVEDFVRASDNELSSLVHNTMDTASTNTSVSNINISSHVAPPDTTD